MHNALPRRRCGLGNFKFARRGTPRDYYDKRNDGVSRGLTRSWSAALFLFLRIPIKSSRWRPAIPCQRFTHGAASAARHRRRRDRMNRSMSESGPSETLREVRVVSGIRTIADSARVPAPLRHLALRFTADVFPRLSSISNSTC